MPPCRRLVGPRFRSSGVSRGGSGPLIPLARPSIFFALRSLSGLDDSEKGWVAGLAFFPLSSSLCLLEGADFFAKPLDCLHVDCATGSRLGASFGETLAETLSSASRAISSEARPL